MEWSAAGEDEPFPGVFVWDGSELISRGDGGQKHLAGRPSFFLLVYGSCSCGGVCRSHREQVQPRDMSNIENSDSPLALQVQLPAPKKTSHRSDFLGPVRGFRASVPGGNGEVDRTQGDCATLPKGTDLQYVLRRWRSVTGTAAGCGRRVDTGANETWGSFSAVGYESKNLHTHWWHSRSVKELRNCSSSKLAAII